MLANLSLSTNELLIMGAMAVVVIAVSILVFLRPRS